MMKIRQSNSSGLGTFKKHKLNTSKVESTAPGLSAARLAQTLHQRVEGERLWMRVGKASGQRHCSDCPSSAAQRSPAEGPLHPGKSRSHGKDSRGAVMGHQRPPKGALRPCTRDDATNPQGCKGQCQTGPCKGGTWAFPPGPKRALIPGILYSPACGSVAQRGAVWRGTAAGDPQHRGDQMEGSNETSLGLSEERDAS